MKRFIPVCAIVFAMIVGMILGACGTNTVNANTTTVNTVSTSDLTFIGNSTRVMSGILVDSETGVNYIIVHGGRSDGFGIAITPRLNEDGTLYISPTN